MESQKRMREEWLDAIKAIGVIAIVFSHAGFKGTFINYFMVPIFFFAAGYTFKLVVFRKFIIGKLKRLYVPFVLIGAISLLLHNIIYECGIYSFAYQWTQLPLLLKEYLRFNIVEEINAPCWFIFAIFMLYVCFYIMVKIGGESKKGILIIGSMCLILCVIGIINLNTMRKIIWGNCAIISLVCIGLIFFWSGWIAKKMNFSEMIRGSGKTAWLTFVCGIIILCSVRIFVEVPTVDYRTCFFFNKYLMIPISFCGIWVASFFTIKILPANKFINSGMSYIGKHTLAILLFHTIAFLGVSIIQINVLNYDKELFNSWTHSYGVGIWKWVLALCGIEIPLIGNWFGNLCRNKLERIRNT